MMPADAPATVVVISSAVPADGTGTTIMATSAGQRDQVIKVITPLLAILIRAGKTYLQTLVGLLSAGTLGMASNVLPPGDFLHTLYVCAGLSVASGVFSLLTNVLLLLTALGDKYPTLKT